MIAPPPGGKVTDITCKRFERLLDGLAEKYGIADQWRIWKAELPEG